MSVNIAGLDKAAVIMALHAAAKPKGWGALMPAGPDLARFEAEALVGVKIDHYEGRELKVQIGPGDSFEEHWFDRANGSGAAQRDGGAVRAATKGGAS